MGTPIQKLRRHIAHLPYLSFLGPREFVSEAAQTPRQVSLEQVAVTFKECEGCAPTAEEVEAREQERAKRFKGDQLLPIMGWSRGGPPS